MDLLKNNFMIHHSNEYIQHSHVFDSIKSFMKLIIVCTYATKLKFNVHIILVAGLEVIAGCNTCVMLREFKQ